jgi:hypothetical protein
MYGYIDFRETNLGRGDQNIDSQFQKQTQRPRQPSTGTTSQSGTSTLRSSGGVPNAVVSD